MTKWSIATVFVSLALCVVSFYLLVNYGLGARIDMGTLPAWVSALGTAAGFAGLLIAIDEWRHGRAEARDDAKADARLVVVVPTPTGSEHEEPNSGQFKVVNYGERPVTNLRIVSIMGDTESLAMTGDGSDNRHFTKLEQLSPIPVLNPGAEALGKYHWPMLRGHGPEGVMLKFVDNAGVRWVKDGNNEPVRDLSSRTG
ncbi:hypothetical protein ACUY3U_05285 [Gordonia amicalis]